MTRKTYRPIGGAGKGPPFVPRLINRLTSPNSAPAPVLRFHQWIYSRSDGRIGPGMIGAWTLLLHTIGRRSSKRRTTALVFARDGERIVVAASNDGKDQSPAWYLNLCTNPRVELQIGREHLFGTATVIDSSDPEYRRLWELMNRTNNRRYDAYQSKTSRSIPIVTIVSGA
jgi:deazaflavin-dependent oxidoreductase (nitroreductase family)